MKPEVQETPVKSKEEKKEYGKFDKWEIESAARTLVEAEEIKADKEKMKYVSMCMTKKHAAEKKAIESIDDIRAARAGKDEEYKKE